MGINNQIAIDSIKNKLQNNGFDLNNAPQTNILIETMVDTILDEVKKGTINTTVTGSSATGGPVTGTGKGTIS